MKTPEKTKLGLLFDPDLIEAPASLPVPLPKPDWRKGNPAFQKGKPNPYYAAKRGGDKIGLRTADPATRTLFLLEKYGVKKIIDFYKKICKGEHVPVSSPDALIVGRIARAYISGEELERLYNRSYGKVPDRNVNLNLNLDATPEQLSERALELLARIAPQD